jgi:hypothetical protein
VTLDVLTSLATIAAGLAALAVIPFLARRGSAARAMLYGLIGAVFCFSFGRWLAVQVAGAWGSTPPGQGTLLTGGLPLRPFDALIFLAFLALATLRARHRRRRVTA